MINILKKKSCIDAGNGNTSNKGATSEDQCHSKCNGQYLPANSIDCEACPRGYLCKSGDYRKNEAHQGIYLCPRGYFLDINNETKINIGYRVEDLVVRESVCSPCRGLYDETYTENTSNKDIVNNLYFYSNRFCLSSDYGKPKPDRANNSNSNLKIARKSCYISGSVDKNWGDNTINNLDIMGNCFYDDQDGNKTVEKCYQLLPPKREDDVPPIINPDVGVA